MLKTDASIEQIAKEVKDLLGRHIRVDQLILFGSRNNGTPREDSDFDIAVISEDFEHMSELKKIELFARIPVYVDSRIELLGFSKHEFFDSEKSSLLAMIKQTGRVLLV